MTGAKMWTGATTTGVREKTVATAAEPPNGGSRSVVMTNGG